MSQSSNFRIQRDLKELLTAEWDDMPPIMATPLNDRLHHIAALVMGPPNTPYHSGFFTFDLKFTAGYPNEPPTVRILSTSDGRVRLNPNLYADGKVCLSVLGTFRGETSEVWRSSYSIRYILQAIQSMVLNEEPYHNEPGFEKERLNKGVVLLLPPNHPGFNDSAAKEEEVPESTETTPVAPEATPEVSGEKPSEGGETAKVPVPPPKAVKKRLTLSGEQLRTESHHYQQKIAHDSIRVSVCDVLECLLGIAPPPLEVPAPPTFSDQNERQSMSPNLTMGEEEPGMEAHGASKEQQPLDNIVSPSTTPTTTSPNLQSLEFAQAAQQSQQVTPAMAPSANHIARLNFIASTRVDCFASEIKRQFMMRYQSYIDFCKKDEYLALDGQPFKRAMFEFSNNTCDGFFKWRWLLQRLERIHKALRAETDAWGLQGRELTGRRSYASCDLMDEGTRLAVEVPGVTGGPLSSDNAYVWQISIMSPEGLYEEGFYTVDVTFSPDQEQPPRCRFVQPIWHPNISPEGVPYYSLWDDRTVPPERRFGPMFLAQSLKKLLTSKPVQYPTAILNDEAAEECFSQDESKVKTFKTKARRLARRTVD